MKQANYRQYNTKKLVINITYQIYRDNKPTNEFYASKWTAENEINSRNRVAIYWIMRDINKMNGAIRGRNKQAFEDAVDAVANPPYSMKKIHIG